VKITWGSSTNQVVQQWVLQFQIGGVWTTEILQPSQTSRVFVGDLPEVVAVTTENRFGVLSVPTVVALKGK